MTSSLVEKTFGINELAKMRYALAIRAVVGFSKKVLFLSFKLVRNALCLIYVVEGSKCAAFVSKAKFEIAFKKAEVYDIYKNFVVRSFYRLGDKVGQVIVHENLDITVEILKHSKYGSNPPIKTKWFISVNGDKFDTLLYNPTAAYNNKLNTVVGQSFTFLHDAIDHVCK